LTQPIISKKLSQDLVIDLTKILEENFLTQIEAIEIRTIQMM